MKIKIIREVKIGLVAVGTILLFIWGLNYMKGTGLFVSQMRFYAKYEQVTGLIVSNAIKISGVKIGQVSKIYFHPDGSGNIMVEGLVETKVNIPDNSVARLYSADLLGTREIEIILGDSDTHIQHGDTLDTYISASIQEEVSQQMLPFKHKAENLLAQMDSVMAVIQYVFNAESRDNIALSLENIKKTIANFESTTYTLDTTFYAQATRIAKIIANAESITSNLEQNNESITKIIRNFEAVSDSLATAEIKQTINSANIAISELNDVLKSINQGEGSLGLLLQDESLFKNLQGSSYELEKLLESIKDDPKKYFNISVFGR